MILQPGFEIPLLRGPVPFSHLIMRSFITEGGKAVDATCGNGNDTLVLASLIGLTGRIWGFDIQENAIEETGRRLSEAGLDDRVTLIQAGHEDMEKHLAAPVKAVFFNLGYLPGGDRSIITRPETTIAALNQSLKLLEPFGIVMLTVYPGHSGGISEKEAVDCWSAALDPRRFHSWRLGQVNVTPDAPYAIFVQKAA